jgi:hypothetical protein
VLNATGIFLSTLTLYLIIKIDMMKQIVIAFISIFSSVISTPHLDSLVEIRIKLIEEVNVASGKNIALSVSIINHSNNDVYLPGLKNVGYYSGLHLYIKEMGKFNEIDLLGQKIESNSSMFMYTGNAITSYLWDMASFERHSQDSLIKIFCQSQGLSLEKLHVSGGQPLFLKSNQELDDFETYNIEHISKKIGDYKICFAPVKVDSAYSPEDILGYKRYDQNMIESNVIYYSTIAP